MTLPYREWTEFCIRTIERLSDDNAENTAAKWTTGHYRYSKIGSYTEGVNDYWSWKTISRPTDELFALIESMDEIIDFGVTISAFIDTDDCGPNDFDFFWEALDCTASPKRWVCDTVTGRHYDGVNQWHSYPYYMGCPNGDKFEYLASAYPIIDITKWIASRTGAGQTRGNDSQEELFRNGTVFYLDLPACGGGCSSPLAVGEELSGHIDVHRLRVHYFNAVVNSLSRYIVPNTGGVEVILSGLAFDQDDDEINDTSRSILNNPGAWGSLVDQIHFIGLQGQGTTTIQRALGDFTIDSDTQITIPSMPALTKGSYRIKLEKIDVAFIAKDIESYAGAWRSNPDGYVYQGEEFNLFVVESDHVAIKTGTVDLSERDPRRPDIATPFLLLNFRMKQIDGENYVYKGFAPIDTRGNEKFWDGRLEEVSGLTRAINDETGLYISSDMTARFSNTDKEFSKLLASYYIKNEPIELFTAFKDYPEAFKTVAFQGFIEDAKLKGQSFETLVRDLTSVYFRRKVPLYRITAKEYPDCHENFLGKPIPETIGLLYHSATEASGAMEAAYVDTVNFKYLAARWIPYDITEVYKDGVLVDPANYAIVYDANGRTYLVFAADQESAKITFNCKGYAYSPWNSVNGYVQHPVYVLLYFLAFIMEIPLAYINQASFENIKDILDDMDPAIATSGYWGTMEESTADETLKELIISCGAGALFPDKEGRLKLDMKDISNIITTKFIFAQIDTKEHPENDFGYTKGVNRVKTRWNFIPAAGIFKGSKQEDRDSALVVYSGNYQEDPNPIDIKWTTSETLVDNKIQTELDKRSRGYKRFKFAISLDFVDYIDVFDSFRLQDPFGVSQTGAGEFGRYLYAERLDYDYQSHVINVEALDLSYLMRRYLVLGDENEHASNWSSATEEDKAFAYLCDEITGKFPDGEHGKMLVDENRLRSL